MPGDLLQQSCGAAPIETVADRLGCSRKHLAASFREHIGLSPKTAARVIRFNTVLDGLRAQARFHRHRLSQRLCRSGAHDPRMPRLHRLSTQTIRRAVFGRHRRSPLGPSCHRRTCSGGPSRQYIRVGLNRLHYGLPGHARQWQAEGIFLHFTATKIAPAAMSAMPIQFGHDKFLAQKNHPDHRHQQHAQFVDRRDLGRLADLERAEITHPRRTGRQARQRRGRSSSAPKCSTATATARSPRQCRRPAPG